MVSFKMKLAGVPFHVRALYGSTRDFCFDYLTKDAPVFEVALSRADILEERQRALRVEAGAVHGCDARVEAPRSAWGARGGPSDESLETLALCRRAMERLVDYGVLLFHGSAIALDGRAYVFTAKSGVGKTTHTRLWLRNVPGCHVLNGDKPLLRFQDDGIFVCGSPWQGKENYGCNVTLPLGAVCLIERGDANRIERISGKSALEALLCQTHHPRETELARSVGLAGRLASVRLYRLRCTMDDQAAIVAYLGMVGDVR